MFEPGDVELLLRVARDASIGGTFERRFEAIAATLHRLVPSMASTAIVVAPGLDGPPAEARAFFRELDPADGAAYAAHYVQHDPCPAVAIQRPGEPVALSDLLPAQRFGRDAYTGELLIRHGIRDVIGFLVRVPGGNWLSIGLHREPGRAGFSRREREVLRLVAPDLARAAFSSLVAEKLAARARALDGGEEAEGPGAVLFDEHGDLVHADRRALACVGLLAGPGELPPDALFDDVRRLLAPEARVGEALERLLSGPGPGGAVVAARSTLVEVSPARRVLTLLEPVSTADRNLRLLARRSGLTAREVEVARLAAAGLSNAEIARRLDLSPATVNVHVGRVYRKAGLAGRKQLIRVVTGLAAPQ